MSERPEESEKRKSELLADQIAQEIGDENARRFAARAMALNRVEIAKLILGHLPVELIDRPVGPAAREVLTPAQVCEKFPALVDSEIMTEHLIDLICPNCGDRDNLKIELTTWGWMMEDGIDHDGDNEYEDSSPCRCMACMFEGTLKDFTVEGLDDYLSDLRDEQEDGGSNG